MGALRAEYQNFCKETEADDKIIIWSRALANDDPVFILKAVDQFIANNESGFAPSVGQIRTLAKEIRKKEWDQRQREIDLLPEPETKGVPMPEEIRIKLEAFKKGLSYE